MTDDYGLTNAERRIRALEAALAASEAREKRLREACGELMDVAQWYTSFFHDVREVAPIYFDLCADLNATLYLYHEADAISERARAALAPEREEQR